MSNQNRQCCLLLVRTLHSSVFQAYTFCSNDLTVHSKSWTITELNGQSSIETVHVLVQYFNNTFQWMSCTKQAPSCRVQYNYGTLYKIYCAFEFLDDVYTGASKPQAVQTSIPTVHPVSCTIIFRPLLCSWIVKIVWPTRKYSKATGHITKYVVPSSSPDNNWISYFIPTGKRNSTASFHFTPFTVFSGFWIVIVQFKGSNLPYSNCTISSTSCFNFQFSMH